MTDPQFAPADAAAPAPDEGEVTKTGSNPPVLGNTDAGGGDIIMDSVSKKVRWKPYAGHTLNFTFPPNHMDEGDTAQLPSGGVPLVRTVKQEVVDVTVAFKYRVTAEPNEVNPNPENVGRAGGGTRPRIIVDPTLFRCLNAFIEASKDTDCEGVFDQLLEQIPAGGVDWGEVERCVGMVLDAPAGDLNIERLKTCGANILDLIPEK